MKLKILMVLIVSFLFGVIGFNFATFKAKILKPIVTKFYVEPFRDGNAIDEDHLISTLDNGMSIIVNKHDECVCWHVRAEGYWDSSELSIIRKIIKPGFSIVEAGANFGVYTLIMSGLVGDMGHVYAFEANPKVSRYLKQSVFDLNHLKNVAVYEKGLGNQNDSLYLNFDPKNIGGGTLSSVSHGTAVSAQTVRLDDILTDVKIDVLKMDTEGYESKILEGASSLIRNNPQMIIIMEWSQDFLRAQDSDPRMLLSFLKNHGFLKAWRMGDRHSKEAGTLISVSFEEILKIPYCDLIFSRQDLE